MLTYEAQVKVFIDVLQDKRMECTHKCGECALFAKCSDLLGVVKQAHRGLGHAAVIVAFRYEKVEEIKIWLKCNCSPGELLEHLL